MDAARVLKHLLPEPPRDRSEQTLAAFSRLWRQAEENPGLELAYDLPAPKWQFLSWLAETRPVVLHGSSLTALDVIEPRQANDVRDFSAQNAIYATTDGIWVLFFAILNREQIPMYLFNAAVSFRAPGQPFSPPFYLFSLNQEALERGPYCPGMVYILPRDGFLQDPMRDFGGIEISVPQWAGSQAALPLARLRVEPADFPFLAQVHPHDPTVLRARIAEQPDGFPWMDD